MSAVIVHIYVRNMYVFFSQTCMYILVYRIQHEDLSDDEVWESVEDEVSEEEEEGGDNPSLKKKYHTPDSDLKPAARLRVYDSNSWRMEVSLTYLLL